MGWIGCAQDGETCEYTSRNQGSTDAWDPGRTHVVPPCAQTCQPLFGPPKGSKKGSKKGSQTPTNTSTRGVGPPRRPPDPGDPGYHIQTGYPKMTISDHPFQGVSQTWQDVHMGEQEVTPVSTHPGTKASQTPGIREGLTWCTVCHHGGTWPRDLFGPPKRVQKGVPKVVDLGDPRGRNQRSQGSDHEIQT